MKTFVLIFLTFICNFSFADVNIKALIPKGTQFLATNMVGYLSQKNNFPQKHYDIESFTIMRFNENIKLTSHKEVRAGTYKTIVARGSLELESFTLITGIFKYRLSIEVKKLSDLNTFANIHHDITLKGKTYFEATKQPNFILVGRIDIINNKMVLTSLNKSFALFELNFSPDGTLILTAQQDIPIIVSVEDVPEIHL